MMSIRVQVPADVDREDRLLGDLTGRQLVTLLIAGLLAYLVWTVTGPAHLVVCVAGIAPIAVVAAVLTWGRRDGVSLDRVLIAAARQRIQTPTAPGPHPAEADRDTDHDTDHDTGTGTGAGRTRAGSGRGGRGRLVVPRSPVRGVHAVTTELAVADPGSRGMAVVCAVTPIPLALRSEAEQDQAVTGLASWLQALSGPVHIVARTRPADLGEVIAAAHARAARIAHPALAAAARDHACHLAALAADTDLTRHEYLLAFRDPTPARPAGTTGAGLRGRAALTAAETLWRRADEAISVLGRIGIAVRVLDAPAAADALRAATRPDLRTQAPDPTSHRPDRPARPHGPGPDRHGDQLGPAAPIGRGRRGRRGWQGWRDDPPTVELPPIHDPRDLLDPRDLRDFPFGSDAPTGPIGPPTSPPISGNRPAPLAPDGVIQPDGPPDPHRAQVDDAGTDGGLDDVEVEAHTAADEAAGRWWPGRITAALNPQDGQDR